MKKKNVKLKIDLKSNPSIDQLTSGEYLLYFIYYTGDDLTKTIEESPTKSSFLDEAFIKEDLKKYKADVFNGWVRSNLCILLGIQLLLRKKTGLFEISKFVSGDTFCID